MKKDTSLGFTLIETMVAISLLTIAIVVPMTLASQSLASAYYARDQVTAFYLAQEALEGVRSIRDGNVLSIAENIPGACTPMTLFCGIPIGQPFTIDARVANSASAINTCGGTCPPLQTDGTFYGYPGGTDDPSLWSTTNFTRTVTANYVGTGQDEIRVTVTVSWATGGIQARTFSISENMYRWVNDGAASAS